MTVMMQAPSLQDTMTSLAQQLAQLKEDIARTSRSLLILATPVISDTAAEVVRHATGEKFICATSSSLYQDMGATHPHILQLSAATGTPAQSIVQNIDGVIDRWHNQYDRVTSPAALQAEVRRCEELIAANPSLRQTQYWECWIIENFQHFQAAFAPADVDAAGNP